MLVKLLDEHRNEKANNGRKIWTALVLSLIHIYIAQNSAGNLEYFIALINSVCEKEASVTIAAKTLMSEALVVPEASANLLMIVMCVVIPIAIMVLGLLIWNYRRKR